MAISNRRSRALTTMLVLSLLGGCSSSPKTPEAPPPTPTPPPQQMASPVERARMHTELAGGYYERGQMAIAIEELNLAVAADANYAPAYNTYGLVYAVLGDDRKAEQSFQRALQLAPADSDFHHNWGWYLCQHKREREALEQFEIAVRNPLYKTPEIALVNAGRCAITIGDMRLAEGYFRRALLAQPHRRVSARAPGRGIGRHHTQDSRRRYRCRVRSACRPGP